jgi:phage-related protein
VDARDGTPSPIEGTVEAAARGADAASMHGLLHASAMELVGMGTTSRQALAAMTVSDQGHQVFQAQNTNGVGGGVLHLDAQYKKSHMRGSISVTKKKTEKCRRQRTLLFWDFGQREMKQVIL